MITWKSALRRIWPLLVLALIPLALKTFAYHSLSFINDYVWVGLRVVPVAFVAVAGARALAGKERLLPGKAVYRAFVLAWLMVAVYMALEWFFTMAAGIVKFTGLQYPDSWLVNYALTGLKDVLFIACCVGLQEKVGPGGFGHALRLLGKCPSLTMFWFMTIFASYAAMLFVMSQQSFFSSVLMGFLVMWDAIARAFGVFSYQAVESQHLE